MKPPKEIKNFIDENGIIKSWPSKKGKQKILIEYLAANFQEEIIYTEKEINDILNNIHLFNDPALLRRELYDMKYLDRSRDCKEYWKRKLEQEQE